MHISDVSSDVYSSDLCAVPQVLAHDTLSPPRETPLGRYCRGLRGGVKGVVKATRADAGRLSTIGARPERLNPGHPQLRRRVPAVRLPPRLKSLSPLSSSRFRYLTGNW